MFIYNALLRPICGVAFLAGDRRAIWLAGLATIGFLIATLGVIAVGLHSIALMHAPALLAGALFAPPVAMLYAGIAVMTGSAGRSLKVGVGFMLMRCQIAIAPPAAIVLSLVFESAYQHGQGAYYLILLLPAMFGVWFAGLIVVVLAVQRPEQKSDALRWGLAIGGGVVGALLWWSPALQPYGSAIGALLCAGISVGMLRPISYLWEAPLDLGLLFAARLGVPAVRLLALHPATYDDLGLLPLPGLYRLLLRACASNCADGGGWVLRVARNPRYEGVARRVIDQIARDGRYAHSLLFWLSTQAEGVAFLRRMVQEMVGPHPTTVAYTTFAQIESPEAWAPAIAQQRNAIAAAAPLYKAEMLLAVLDAAAGTLRAQRWPEAIEHLQASVRPRGAEPAALAAALGVMQAWAEPMELFAGGAWAGSLRQSAPATLAQWPGALVSTVGEHLSYLLTVEQHRSDHGAAASPQSGLRNAVAASPSQPMQSALRRHEQRFKPPASTPQILHIYIARLPSEENTYQFTLDQPGLGRIRGPARMDKLVTTNEVRAIRAHYEQQLRMVHELIACGVPIAPPEQEALVKLGRRIAELLPPLAQRSIIDSVQRAQRQRSALRILLEVAVDARILLDLPWELLLLPLTHGPHTDQGEGFLLLNADITLTRQLHGAGRNTEPELPRPFTCQVIAAAPADGQPIDLESTQAAIAAGLMLEDAEADWYAGTDTLGTLQEYLWNKNPDILHLLCHGEQSDTGRGLRSDLLFVHRDGYIQRINAFDLAPLMTLAPNLQIVILQACYAGLVNTPPPETAERERLSIESIALTLVRHGLPAVVAMQGEVRQDAADAFVRTLYAALRQGRSLDKAVAAGRIAMRAVGGIVDWSLPVLYQGSGQPEPATWYMRFADRLDAALIEPATLRALRGLLIAWALTLFVLAIVRMLALLPAPPSVTTDRLVLPLLAWCAVGVVGPAIIAATHRSIRYQPELTPLQRRMARNAQWIGAYLGYTVSGIVGLGGFVSLWVFGASALFPHPWPQICFGGLLAGSLVFSYVTARSQVRSALAIAVVDTRLFDLRSVGLVLTSMALLLLAPLLLLFPGIAAVLLHPAVAALALTMGIITLVALAGGDHAR
jgi:hypothetical protein